MKQERLKVLEMLEAGKISADEATKLLEAMKGTGHEYQAFSIDEEKLGKFTAGVDNFAKEFGSRVESFYHEVEPRIKKASQKVLEKTASVFDEISRSLNESLENAKRQATQPEGCGCGCDMEGGTETPPDDNAPREN